MAEMAIADGITHIVVATAALQQRISFLILPLVQQYLQRRNYNSPLASETENCHRMRFPFESGEPGGA